MILSANREEHRMRDGTIGSRSFVEVYGHG